MADLDLLRKRAGLPAEKPSSRPVRKQRVSVGRAWTRTAEPTAVEKAQREAQREADEIERQAQACIPAERKARTEALREVALVLSFADALKIVADEPVTKSMADGTEYETYPESVNPEDVALASGVPLARVEKILEARWR